MAYSPYINDEESFERALVRIWQSYNGIKHVWDPSGWPFQKISSEPSLNLHLITRGDARVILLSRRNILRRIVSNQIALQIQNWRPLPQSLLRSSRFRLRALDLEWIKLQLERERPAIDECRAAMIRTDSSFLEVSYEELFGKETAGAERDRKLEEVFTFLRLSPVELSARASMEPLLDQDGQTSSAEIYEKIPNVEHIERQLGSDETGWLSK